MAITDNSSDYISLPPVNITYPPVLSQNFTLQTTTAIIEVTGLLGNAFVIFVILRTKNFRSRLPNQFIINQSIIDLCSCISLISFVLPKRKTFSADNLPDQLYCKLISSHAFSWGLVFSSTYSLIALTIERYLSVVHPIWHKEQCTKKKAYSVMILTWAFGLAEGIGHAVPTSYIEASYVEDGVCYTFSKWPNAWVRSFAGVITCTLHYILPITVLVFLYGKMIMVISGRIKKVAPANLPLPPADLLNVPSVASVSHSHATNSLPPAQMCNIPPIPSFSHSHNTTTPTSTPAKMVKSLPIASGSHSHNINTPPPAQIVNILPSPSASHSQDTNTPPPAQIVNVLPVPSASHSRNTNTPTPAQMVKYLPGQSASHSRYTNTPPAAQMVNVLPIPSANHSHHNIPQPQAFFNVAANGNAGPIWPKAKRNVIHTLAVVSVIFALCWSMNQIYYLMMCLGYPPDFSSTFYNITVLTIYLNSCINPIVYFVKYEQFKKAAIKILKVL